MELPKYFYFRVKSVNNGTAIEVEDASNVDVVEVVRCKDCVYWEQATDNSGNCNRAFEITAYVCDFCSYGERKEE